MPNRRLLWQLYPSYLFITLLCVLGATWYAARAVERFYRRHLENDLLAKALIMEEQAAQLMDYPQRLNDICRELGQRINTRFTVINPDGKVIADSHYDPGVMERHDDRREIREALKGSTGVHERRSPTLEAQMLYVAIPIRKDGQDEIIGAVRASLAMESVTGALGEIYLQIILGGVVVAALAGGLCYLLSRRISRPLEEMRLGAAAFAKGEFDIHLSTGGAYELSSLAASMNEMARQLEERIRTISRQRSVQGAILFSMVEGVIAVAVDERVITINHAAAEMFHVTPDEAHGRILEEVIRNRELQNFVGRALSETAPVEGEVVIRNENERFLQAHGAMLRDANGGHIGAVIVLNDVTRLRRLEDIRRDFVANVSHELRTPITSIKGFVETLQDGAIGEPEDARRFLAIIARQADRLNAIIEDLLLLSQVEQDAERRLITLKETRLKTMLISAVQACEIKAAEKKMAVEVDCPDDLEARINSPLLEQAVINLVDNAIKYSDPGRSVRVEAAREVSGVCIRVRDEGCGIDAENLSRIFERFYRVDKGRSRKLGGTGLGLAIVKHIAQAHGGRVSAESEPGEGSVFSIHLSA